MIALLLLGAAVGLSGSIVYSRGAARREEGLAIARDVSRIETQLSTPPAEVIAEVRRGWLIADRGSRLMRGGTALSLIGWGSVLLYGILRVLGVIV